MREYHRREHKLEIVEELKLKREMYSRVIETSHSLAGRIIKDIDSGKSKSRYTEERDYRNTKLRVTVDFVAE